MRIQTVIKKIVSSITLIFLINPVLHADLATSPVSYSCDEMYYAFYYDLEKVRSLWNDFQHPASTCNKRVITWLSKDYDKPERSYINDMLSSLTQEQISPIIKDTSSITKQLFSVKPNLNLFKYSPIYNEEHMAMVRSKLPYSVMNKEDIVYLLQTLNLLPENINLENLSDENYLQKILSAKVGFPDLISIKELISNINTENNKAIKGSLLHKHIKDKWSPPIVGQGASSVLPYGYFRIDHIDSPVDLGKAISLRCSDIYRGFGECEQDCIYLRNILIDMHSKIRLFLGDWDWENDKMICTPQSAVKKSLVPFDASYCKVSCPGSEIPCTTCSFKLNGADEITPITCLSKQDAIHASNLYCFLNGQAEGCNNLKCNTTFNVGSDEDITLSAQNELVEAETKTNTGEISAEGNVKWKTFGATIKVGANRSLDFIAEVKTGLRLYTQEGPTTITKYFTERNDGTLFECSKEMINNEKIACEELDEMIKFPGAKKICDEDNLNFLPCKEYQMGDGRAFFNCTAEITHITATGHGGQIALMADYVLLDGELKFSLQHGTELLKTVGAESKKFNAGGITLKQMRKTCNRWSNQWLKMTTENIEMGPVERMMIPGFWPKQTEFSFKKQGIAEVKCSIMNPHGDMEKVTLSSIMLKVGFAQEMGANDIIKISTKEKRAGKQRKSKLKAERVLKLAFKIDQRQWALKAEAPLSNYLSDMFVPDYKYPLPTGKIKTRWFNIPLNNEFIKYISRFHSNDINLGLIKMFFSEIKKNENNELRPDDYTRFKECEIIEKPAIDMYQQRFEIPLMP